MKTHEPKETQKLNDKSSFDTAPEWAAEAVAEVARFEARRSRRRLTEIIMHCSATPSGRQVTLEDIRRWHVEERGWKDVGYHFVVETDGRIRAGRPLHMAGAHCLGHNAASVGICYVGGVDADMHACDTRTSEQRRALAWLVGLLRRRLGPLPVWGHRDFAPKACPCFDAATEYACE